MTRHAASATGPWVVEATLASELTCPRRSNGCGDYSNGFVTPEQAVSGPLGLWGTEWVALLQTPPDVTASVELSVAPES